MLEHLIIAIAPYLFITAGLALCMYMFYLLKCEIYSLHTRLQEHEAERREDARKAQMRIEELQAELREAEQRTAQLVPPPPLKSGLNVNTRTQVIRMFRHGDAEEAIASKLGLPRSEVKLLLKVHKLAVNGQPAGGNDLTSSAAAC